MQSISHSPIEFVPPLNQEEYLDYCHKLEQGIYDNKTEHLKELINLRSKYVFLKLKEITNSTIDNFDFINAYDNDAGMGFFDHKEFKENISFMGNFSDKYSKPYFSILVSLLCTLKASKKVIIAKMDSPIIDFDFLSF